MQELRPLGAGEVLDRAVTLFVRRFLPIVAVLAVVTVPLLIVDDRLSPGSSLVSQDLGRILSAGANRAASAAAMHAFVRDNAASLPATLVAIASVLVRLLTLSALIATIGAAYGGTSLNVGAAYRVGAACWPAQFLVGLTFLVGVLVATIPVVIVYAIVLIVVIAAVAALKSMVIAVAAAVVGGIVVVALIAALWSWCLIAYELAAVAVVLERMRPIAAIGLGLRRALGPQTRWRSLAGGLILFALSLFGALPLLAVAALLGSVAHVPALYFAVAGAGGIVLQGLTTAFVVVFAVDLRVRCEGLDLAHAVEFSERAIAPA